MAADHDIPRRQLDFAFDPAVVPRDWCKGDAYATTFMDALSLLFPEGERFFVDSVKQVRDRVESPALAAQIDGFIGQEAMHGKEHRGFNEMLVGHGYAAAPTIEGRLRWFLGVVRRVLSPGSQLAVTCALEHFTALLAEALLRRDALREEIDPSIQPLWIWHALEESEHKAVAFDVYRATGHGYFRRVIMMLVTTLFFYAIVGATQVRLMWTRGILFRPWRWLRAIGRMWIWPGHFLRLVPGYFAYFRPGFHPDDRDTRDLLAIWRERLFGDAGALRAQLRATSQ